MTQSQDPRPVTQEMCPHGKRPGEAWCEPCFRAEQRQRWGYSPHDYCDFIGRANG